MKKLLIKLIINAVALYAAVTLLNGNGIHPQSNGWVAILFLAVIFGLVNTILRPIVMTLGCPIIILTLGLGTLLVNTLLFYLTGILGTQFGIGFTVDGFIPAFLGALIVSVVSFLLSMFFNGDKKEK